MPFLKEPRGRMILSMTGYGSAERTHEGWSIRTEARSVNHGDLRVNVRLPDMLRLRETELVKLVQGRLSRGHVHLFVECRLAEEALEQMVDRERLAGLLRVARQVAHAEGVPFRVDMAALLALPGVMSADVLPTEARDELWEQVAGAVRDALDALIGMRRAEGENLAAQMRALCERIAARTDAVAAQSPACVKECKARLVERVRELLEGTGVTIDADVLARELAVLAERSDVSEEVTRMRSHLQQVARCLEAHEEPVGLKLEFLSQEMLREANTMAAKLPSGELVNEAVEMKTEVQRLREQARNVE